MKGRRINWRPAELAFIERRRTWERSRLHTAFVKKFRRRDVALSAIQSLCKRNGWLTGSRKGRGVGRLRVYTKAELSWIKRRRTMPRRALHAAFIAAFPHHTVSLDAFKALCQAKGFKTGRDGRIAKGHVPANKGKKMPYNANSARTQFKKGHRSGRAAEKYKPVGSERFSKEGYLERKIHEGLPMQSRWRAVHLLNWERANGPIPEGHCLKSKGNKLNTDPSNWELVPRALLPRLNGRYGRGYDGASAELKMTIMAVAKLEHQIRAKRRAAS